MEKYSCESHIDHALDMFVAEQKEFPIMDKIEEDKSYPQSVATVNS